MKFICTFALLATSLAFASVPLSAKPPATKEPKPPAATPTPPAAADDTGTNPLAHWLLQQDGQRDAITLPLSQVIHAATGKRVLPFDPANPADAAFLVKLGTILDRLLPLMNRHESPAHAAANLTELDEVAARFEEGIAAAARSTSGLSVGTASETGVPERGYPALCLTDTAAGKSYYLAVALYPSGKHEEAARTGGTARAFTFHPRNGIRRITADGSCLLVGVEYNGKLGDGIAFLNWDVVDVANVPVRAAVTFEADGSDVYHPGAVLTDGRKGSD